MFSRKNIQFLAGLSLIAVLFLAWVKIPRKSPSIDQNGATNQFPTVAGTNLDRVDLEFPRDFAGDYNVLFVPFQQWQQQLVNTWVPFVQQLEADKSGVFYYEFPTVWEMTAARRTFLNEGMRAGIPDQTARERTITLYLDKPSFRSRLDMPSEDKMYVLLVTKSGEIVWRTEGEFSAEKGQSLINALQN